MHIGWLLLPLLLGTALPAAAQTARFAHTVTLLPNGNVLIVGGAVDAAGTPTTSVQIRNTAGFSVQNVAALPVARASHTATLLPNGFVLVAGGVSAAGGAPLNTTVIYNPNADTWTAGPAMSVGRADHTATLLADGRVLLAGGASDASGNATTSCDLYSVGSGGNFYNPAGGSLSAAASLGLGRSGHTATRLQDGRVFVAGGRFRDGGGNEDYAVSTELYNPTSNAWEPGQSLNSKRAFHTATLMGNRRVLISGGYNGRNFENNFGFLETTEIYRADNGSITPGDKMTVRRAHHSASLRGDGRVTVFKGLGNFTTSYLTTPPLELQPGSLLLLGDSGTPSTGTILNTSTLPLFLDNIELSVPSNGIIVDGDIAFSTPAVLLQDAAVRFRFPTTSAPLAGAEFEFNDDDPAAEIDGFDTSIANPGGQVFFATRSVSVPETPTSPRVANNASNSLPYSPPGPLGSEQEATISGGTLVVDNLRIPLPDYIPVGATLLRAAAEIETMTMSEPSDESTHGFDINLDGGNAVLSGAQCGTAFDSDPGERKMLCNGVTFSGVSGGVKSSSANTTTTLPNPLTNAQLSGLEAGGITLKIVHVFNQLDLSNQDLVFNIATITVRLAVFGDREEYLPQDNNWRTPTQPGYHAFNHSTTLLPNGDEYILGGRRCLGTASCTAGTFTPTVGGGAIITVAGLGGTPSWQTLQAMQNGRSHHTATLLPGGRVLVAGGVNGNQVARQSELFDPEAGTWSSGGSLNVARSHHISMLLPNGTVLAAGGFTSATATGATVSAEIFHPDTRTWIPTSPMSSSRAFQTAVLLPDGNVLTMGGFREGAFLETAEIYYSTARRWVPVASMDTRRSQHTATLLHDGRVLVAGGVNVGGVLGESSVSGQRGAEIFNPQTGAWTAAAAMNRRRHSHSATLLRDGRVLVTGGNDGFGEIAEAEIYDPVGNTWTPTDPLDLGPGADMNIPRFGHVAQLLPNGKVLITGGFNQFGQAITEAEGFDVDFSSWQMQGVHQAARGNHTSVLLYDGRVLLAGGNNGLNDLSTVEFLYFGDPPDSLTFQAPAPRQPSIVSVSTGLFDRGASLSVTGQNLKGVTEAAGGGVRGGQSDHAHPRLYLQRLDPGGGGAGRSGGFMVDVSSRIYYQGLNQNWTQADNVVNLVVPETAGLLPYGFYHLRAAANSQFSDTRLIQVGPPKPASGPGIPSGTQVGSSSVAWTWDAASGSDFDGYNVYSATNGVFLGTAPITSPTVTFYHTGLGPGAISLIQVSAYSLSGDGPVAVATRSVTIQSADITGLAGVAQSTSSIRWDWNQVPSATSFQIFSASAGVLVGTSNTNLFVQTGLSTNTAAGVRVRAVTDIGAGPLSDAVTTFTLAMPPQLGFPPLDPVSASTITVSWLANTNPAGTRYSLRHFNEFDSTVITLNDLSGLSLSLTGLLPNTLYTVSMAGINGDDVASSYVSFGSTATRANPPSNLAILATSPSSITIGWSANGNHSATPYRVRVSSDNFATTVSTPIPFSANYTQTSAVIGGLLTGVTYTIEVAARNRFGLETSGVSVQGFTDNGGGPAGSLTLLAKPNEEASTSGNLGSGRLVSLTVYPNTFDQEVRLFITDQAGTPASLHCGNINAAISLTAVPALQPKRPIFFTIGYTPGEPNLNMGALDTLAAVRYDPAGNTCVPLQSSVNKAGTFVRAQTNHLSDFQLQHISPQAGLGSVRVFPNPLYLSRQSYFTFDRLPAGARLRVFTLHGEKLFEGTANSSGLLTWDGTNASGRRIGSGIYLAVAEAGGDKKILKIVVVR